MRDKAPFGGLDPNRATAEELMAVSGIGPETARAIVRHREEHGPIRSWDDLRHLLDEVSLTPEEERSAISYGGTQQSSAADPAEASVTLGDAK